MGSISGDSASESERDESNAHEQKIFVSVRLRPLNERELARNEVSDWECINNTTIIVKNSLKERTQLPAAYTFGYGVFGFDHPTKQLHEEAAKKKFNNQGRLFFIASIFAYGETSSGKTYTMSGVTNCAVVDIYDNINKTVESSAWEYLGAANSSALTASVNCHHLHHEPTHSHVEKSRNTLLFASCAKKVSTNARVNVVMSEKALVKQLQKEPARLENERHQLCQRLWTDAKDMDHINESAAIVAELVGFKDGNHSPKLLNESHVKQLETQPAFHDIKLPEKAVKYKPDTLPVK
ncbi:Kinesin NACK1 [Olea europaea subsp. europaea]|uniref:Kinesin NACK1 n=1 Tax=Olea europaea subsp. europaea TaxID=158383 RepID=A0A8S0VNM4_OLEEU|nr:Kinesin NACK1 [Olea europaea subsp. europaea]